MSEATVARRTGFVAPQGVQRLLKWGDFTVLFVATMAVFLGSLIPTHAASIVGLLALEVALASVLMMSWIGLYGLDVLLKPRRGTLSALAVTVGLASVVFLSTHLGLFALEPWWLWAWLGLCMMYFTVTRAAALLWAGPKAAAGALRQRVAVVGWGQEADEAIKLLLDADPVRIEVIGLFDDRTGQAGDMADLLEAARHRLVDLIVVAIPMSAEHRLLQTLNRLWPLPVDIRISRQVSQLKLSPRAYGYLDKLPLLAVFDRPLTGRRRAKDLLDRTLAALLLAILLPVMGLAALAIGLKARGPVLVKERRYGFDGAAIEVIRLRCTRPGQSSLSGLGRALRRIGLDGLPRLLNVLRGELSLVGPPPRSDEPGPDSDLYRQVIDGYFARHGIKPGLTGWAQINGWAEDLSGVERTAKHDLEYVDRSSLLFDLYILLKAPFALLRNRAAL